MGKTLGLSQRGQAKTGLVASASKGTDHTYPSRRHWKG
jgi:hypothetical protein